MKHYFSCHSLNRTAILGESSHMDRPRILASKIQAMASEGLQL